MSGEVVFGWRATLAVLRLRSAEVHHLFATHERNAELTTARFPVPRGLRIEIKSDADLERIARSNHHEGICVTTKPRAWLAAKNVGEHLVAHRGVAVAFDRVRNPYNLGAILRSAAFFGIDAAIFGALAPSPDLPPDAIRVAEGGVESLAIARTTDLADTLVKVRASGVRIVGLESDGTTELDAIAGTRPLVLVVGHEREGISGRVRGACDDIVSIRGAGAVHSLNVSIAASVAIARIAALSPNDPRHGVGATGRPERRPV